jgi:hypothetical protein
VVNRRKDAESGCDGTVFDEFEGFVFHGDSLSVN